jgi:hypothetical protein
MRALRGPAWLLLVGQILYIAVTQLHAGGDANDHPAIFRIYADDRIWTAVHFGQFASMAVLLMGLIGVFARDGDGWRARSGIAAAAAALALYGALQAVDGVALKQAVDAWAGAAADDKAVRFASAEAIRWLEWGMRSYFDIALGVALLLCAAALWRKEALPKPIAMLAALSGIAYGAQGWIAGTEGFSAAQSFAIVLAWALSLAWMFWLAVAVRRSP